VVAGAGPGLQRIRAIAGDNVEFIGYVDAATLRDYLQRARAFVFAAQEDFGIALVEAQACGTPVIAFGQGGAREIVQGLERDRPTGVFFDRQTIASLQSALQQFEQREPISPHDCHTNACRFSIERFRQDFGDFLETRWKKFQIERSRDH
jgi:glycosyltransferase involved in cell wall biosynthesis